MENEAERKPLFPKLPNTVGVEDPLFVDDGMSRIKMSAKKALSFLGPRVPYYIPICEWLFSYSLHYLLRDFLSGVSLGVILVPQGLAYASLVKVPPIYGLYTAFIPPVVYAIFCNSRQLSLGPEAMISMLVGINCAEILQLAGKQVTEESILPLVLTLTFLVGILTFMFGLLRVGFLDNILSRPILRGFVFAVALSIFLEQVDVFCGFSLPTEHGISKVSYVVTHMDKIHLYTVGIGTISLLILTLFQLLKHKTAHKPRWKFFTFIPEVLLVVLGGIAAVRVGGLDAFGVQVLGHFDGTFPRFVLPFGTFSMFKELISYALIIAIVGFVESIIIAKNYASKHNYTVSANRELVALGLANVVGSFFGSWPCFGSMARSSINDRTGAETPMASVFASLVVLSTITMLFYEFPLFMHLPKTVLSSIVMSAALGLMETNEIFFLFTIKAWTDLFLLFTTAAAAIVFGLEIGLLFSIVVSVFLIIRHSTMPTVVIRGQIPGTQHFQDVKVFRDINIFDKKHEWLRNTTHVTDKGILVARIEDSLYFANMGHIKALLKKIEQTSEIPLHGIILDMKNVHHFDATAVEILLEMIAEYKARGIAVCFVKLKAQNQHIFWKAGLMELIGIEYMFSKTSDAVARLEGKVLDYSSYQIPSKF